MTSAKLRSQLEEYMALLINLHSNSVLLQKVEKAVDFIYQALELRLPVLVCGNGGSAADALHFSGELVANFLQPRSALNVICLNSNVAVLTAWSNDFDFSGIFARQVQAHGQAGGVVLGISTSGCSENVVQAFCEAQKLNMKTIALTGQGGGRLADVADLLIDVHSTCTPRIQELHLPIYHYICEQVEERSKYPSSSA